MWQIWLIAAGVFLILEIFTMGFLVFWLSIGCLLAALISLITDSIIIQTAVFVLSSGVLILATKPLVKKFAVRDNKKSLFKTKVFNNGKLLLAIGASALLVIVILLVPALRDIFSIPVLPAGNILEIVVLVLLPILIVEIFKALKINTAKDE